MSHEATVFPPMANRSLEFLEERTYSPAVRKPSGMGVRTAHAESMTGGRPGIIIERLNVPTRRVSTPSTMRVRVPGIYELIGRLAEETLSGVSTVMYDAPRTPAPIQSPGTAVKGRSNTTKKLSPVPAVIGSGAGRVRRADSGVPDGAVDTSGMSRDVFSWPSRSASRHRATLETSPGNVVAPVTSTRTRRRLTEFVGVVRFSRSMGPAFCPGSMVAGARIEACAVRTSPGGAVPGPKNITAREFPSAEE